MQFYAAGWLLRSTEYADAFPESPPVFKLHCIENFAHQLKKLKGLQNKLSYKMHLCNSFLKKQTHKGLWVPSGCPQQATDWCLFLNWKNGKWRRQNEESSENNKTVSCKL